MEIDQKVVIKSIDDDTVVIAGYGVVFGGRDLEGETFTKDTDFMHELVPLKAVFYDHAAQKEVKHVVGKATATPDDIGIWVEAQLDRHKKYVAEVLKLIEEGVLGWSSGSVGHLVEKSAGVIKRWPIVEFSLTPTPAEPRTLGIERLKALAEEYPALKALLPQGSGDDPGGATGGKSKASLSFPIKEINKMSDVTLSMEEYKDLLKGQVKLPEAPPAPPAEAQDPAVKALSDKLDALTAIIEKSPALKDAGYVAPDSEEDDPEVKSFGDFCIAIRNGNTKRLEKVYGTGEKATKTALAEDAGATGGYLVPVQYAAAITAAAKPFSVLRQAGATVIPLSGRSLQVPLLDIETAPSAGDTSYAAGVVAYWESEAATLTESEPRFRLIELVAHKLAGYSLASNEVRADAPALDALLAQMFGRAVGSKENYAFFRGDGVGKPFGILNSGALITTARSAASTVALADLAQMVSDFLPSSWGRGAWFFNPTVMDQLIQVVSNPLSLMNVDLQNAALPMRILGMPAYVTGALPALNTAGDILLVDPSYYLIADRQAMTIAYSEHYAFVTDQAAWRFTSRVDGQPWVQTYVTLEDAATTVSPFVGLLAG